MPSNVRCLLVIFVLKWLCGNGRGRVQCGCYAGLNSIFDVLAFMLRSFVRLSSSWQQQPSLLQAQV